MKIFKSFSEEFKLKKEKTEFPKSKISSSVDACNFARQFYYDDIDIYESFFVIFLNQANNTLGFTKISQGGITSTVVDSRLIFKYAIETLSTSLILVHNHPSGQLKPSQQDVNLTRQIKEACKFIDVNVLDHIILNADNYYSFADNGQL